MHIGPYSIDPPVCLAPMAGVTDRPFRILCRRFGAGYAVSEMVSANALLWASDKTRRRIDHRGEPAPRAVQIMGADPRMLADAARYNVDQGAQIIDINMGCPAKKVCNVAAGSALLRDEALVGRILEAVVRAPNTRPSPASSERSPSPVMIGRAAQGNPWIFRRVAHYLATGEHLPPPRAHEVLEVLEGHLAALYDFYGEARGVRVARKHIAWYTKGFPGGAAYRRAINEAQDARAQLAGVRAFFAPMEQEERAA